MSSGVARAQGDCVLVEKMQRALRCVAREICACERTRRTKNVGPQVQKEEMQRLFQLADTDASSLLRITASLPARNVVASYRITIILVCLFLASALVSLLVYFLL